ncbi:MAG: glycosyltransferase family 2 protein [Bdellovibrionales bacterium]|jgi:dolichol-phosphate mannosyltransferase
MAFSPALSVIVPCYNEAQGLAETCQRITAACHASVGDTFEILLVNDGSTDETLAVMRGLGAGTPQIAVVNLSRNYGHQMALTAGLSLCAGERALILDADLQDPPEHLAAMMKIMDDTKADVVYGQRTARAGESWFKRASAALFYRLLGRLADTTIPKDTGDFRLISRRTIDILNKMPEQSRFLRGMIGWIGLTQVAFPYERQPRAAGVTQYPLRKMIRFALDAVTSFSIVPLRLASYGGALMGVLGLALLAYVMRAWLAGETVQGWTSLMVVVLVMGSVQLLCLGVLGEYLGRLYIESKRRPPFIVESVTRRGDATKDV